MSNQLVIPREQTLIHLKKPVHMWCIYMHIQLWSTCEESFILMRPHCETLPCAKKMFEKPKTDPQWSKVNPSNPLKVYEKIIVQMTTHSMILIWGLVLTSGSKCVSRVEGLLKTLLSGSKFIPSLNLLLINYHERKPEFLSIKWYCSTG